MFQVGRLCIKIAGRDAGKKCVIVSVLDDVFVLIDGEWRNPRQQTYASCVTGIIRNILNYGHSSIPIMPYSGKKGVADYIKRVKNQNF